MKTFVKRTNKEGHFTIKIRQWHPFIFIPRFINSILYYRGLFRRYKKYEKVLKEIYELDRGDTFTKKGFITIVKGKIEHLDCGYECDFDGRYGFIPEADCPIHDV